MDFLKIREVSKQNKRDPSRASLGNEDEFIPSTTRDTNTAHNDHHNYNQNNSPTLNISHHLLLIIDPKKNRDAVILGMPGPWAESDYEEADIYTMKIGGVPDLPIPLVDEKPVLLKCNTCGSHLSLLAQVYAPVLSTSLTIDKRLIFVFACMFQIVRSPSGEHFEYRKF